MLSETPQSGTLKTLKELFNGLTVLGSEILAVAFEAEAILSL